MKKTIIFSIIVNILSTLGALLYFVAAAALFILIFVITGTIGGLGSTQNYAFGFGLILLIIVVPIALVLIIFPILRITALINSIVASGKLKGENNPKTNMIVAGVFQILDAVITWLFEGILIAIVLAVMVYNGTMSNYVTQYIPNATDQTIRNIMQVAKYIIMIPVLIKSALQIISAIRLFIQAKKLPKKNKKQEQVNNAYNAGNNNPYVNPYGNPNVTAQQRSQYYNPNGMPQYGNAYINPNAATQGGNQYVNPNGVPQYIIPNNNQPGNN